MLQVIEKAFLHFGYDLQDDWAQSLRKIEIKTRMFHRRRLASEQFHPISNEGIEVGILGGQPIYAILGYHPMVFDVHHRFLAFPTATTPGFVIPFSSILDSAMMKEKNDPNNCLHKYAQIFHRCDDQTYWIIMLVATKGLLSDETFKELRKKGSFSQNLRLLLDVNSKWNAKERVEIIQHKSNDKTPKGNDDAKAHGYSATSLFGQSHDSEMQRSSERISPAPASLSNKVRESVASMKSLTPLPRRPYSPSLLIHP
jgi:hypothetical protein